MVRKRPLFQLTSCRVGTSRNGVIWFLLPLPFPYRSFPHLNSVPSSSSTAGRFLFSFYSVALFILTPFFFVARLSSCLLFARWELSQLPGLRRLDLAGLVKVDDEVLKALASTLSLSHVDLSRYSSPATAVVKGCLEPHILETRHKQGEHIETSPLLRVAIAPIKLLGRFHREHGAMYPPACVLGTDCGSLEISYFGANEDPAWHVPPEQATPDFANSNPSCFRRPCPRPFPVPRDDPTPTVTRSTKSAPRFRGRCVGAGPYEPGAGVHFAARDRRSRRRGRPSAVRRLSQAATRQRVDDARDGAGASPARCEG